MKQMFAALALALAASTSFALPTVEDVQAEVAKGRYTQAEAMMREVVAARPGSARAHYIHAEILAHERRFEQAAAELARARQLDPSDKYTDRGRLDAFSALLEREQAVAHQQRDALKATSGGGTSFAQGAAVPPAAAETPLSDRIPGWAWGLGGGVLALAGWRMFSGRGATQTAANRSAYASTGTMGPRGVASYGGSMTPASSGVSSNGPGFPQAGGVPGGGMLGTGLAVAGGVAAGMLAGRLFDGHRDPNGLGNGAPDDGGLGAGLGAGSIGPGLLEGEIENPSARELQERPIDFGSGNDWGDDAGDASSGSSHDGGW